MDNGRDNMLTINSYGPLMQLILVAQSERIEIFHPHPSIGRKQFVIQTRLNIFNLNNMSKNQEAAQLFISKIRLIISKS